MAIDPTKHFAPDYASARRAFLHAAESRGAQLGSHGLPLRGAGDEELAVDTAYLGPDAPDSLIVVSSGIHGAEGFAGSAIQHHVLTQSLDSLDLPANMGLLLVHAINPFGFSHIRRVNESNVDLNRNFLTHPDDHVPNPDYDSLYDAVNPVSLDEESERLNNGAILAFAQEHGFPRLQAALTRGQYVHASGVQFGGNRDEASNATLRKIAREDTRGAHRVGWLDFHTGLGPYGEVELIIELPSSDPAYGRGHAWYGDAQRSTIDGESVSAALNGTIEHGVAGMLDEDVELTIHGAEFGTYDTARVFRAMRADNWLAHYGDLESEAGRAIKTELLEVFRPNDPKWQAQVVATGSELVGKVRNGLAH